MNPASIQVGAWWPSALAAAGIVGLIIARLRKRGVLFPNDRLLQSTAAARGFIDRLPFSLGALIAFLLILSLMDVHVSRSMQTTTRTRDYLVIVDTSRSMRQNTILRRSEHQVTFERKTGMFAGEVDDPASIPEIARYEVARESLLKFLSSRNERDRVGLIYFNSLVYQMAGLTSNVEFLKHQLGNMDSYVMSGTNIRSALEQGLDTLERYPTKNRRAIILLTDAESNNTSDLERQLDRLRVLDIAFYLLWITTDAVNEPSRFTREFLQSAREIGSAFTIEDLEEGFLDTALGEIAELEDYEYSETRYVRIDLSHHAFEISEWMILVWLLLVGSVYLPLRGLEISDRH